MGQKIIPQSLRLNKIKNWNSNWIGDKNEYSKFFYFEYTLEQYLKKYGKTKNFLVTDVFIKKNNMYLDINIHAFIIDVKKTGITDALYKETYIVVKKYLKELNLKHIPRINVLDYNWLFFRLKKYFVSRNKRYPFKIFRFLGAVHIGLHTKNVNIITDFLIDNLKKTPRHKQYLINMNKILQKRYKTFKNCLGYKLQFKGRVNGAARSRKLVLFEGKTPLNTLKYDVKYDFKEIIIPHGVCSLKFWVFYKR